MTAISASPILHIFYPACLIAQPRRAQSGKGELLTPLPHTAEHAGPQHGSRLTGGLHQRWRHDEKRCEQDAGDELPPRPSARRLAAVRTCRSRSTLRFRRKSLSFAFGVKPRHAVFVGYRVVMAGSIETLVTEAMQLPPDQRLTLAHRIMCSVEPAPSSEIDAAWDTEIRERIARYDAGGVRSIPAAEVFAEVDRRLRR